MLTPRPWRKPAAWWPRGSGRVTDTRPRTASTPRTSAGSVVTYGDVVIATGVSCRFSSRILAVTTMDSMVSPLAEYSFFGWCFILVGCSWEPRSITFQCRVCDEDVFYPQSPKRSGKAPHPVVLLVNDDASYRNVRSALFSFLRRPGRLRVP